MERDHLNIEQQPSISEWTDTNAHMNVSIPGDHEHNHQALLKARKKASCDPPFHCNAKV